MKLLYTIIITILLFQFECVGVKAQSFDRAYEVSNVMSDLLKTAPRRKLYRNADERYKFAEDIVWAADKNRIPEFLLTTKTFNESSFRANAVSDDKYKTKGLGQMHGVATKGCDLSTRRGQLDCSAKWLKVCHRKCGTWEGALAAYGTSGSCSMLDLDMLWSERWKRWWAIHRQIKTWLKYEQQREAIRETIIDDMEYYAATKGGE